MELISTRSIPDQPVLAIRQTVPAGMFQSFLGGAFSELYQCLATGGVEPEGPPIARYHAFGPETIDVEVCLPVAAGTIGTGRIMAEVLPAATVATLVHVGPYDEVGAAYGELERWIGTHGFEHGGPPRERYLIGPDAGVTPAEYRTEIEMPVEASALASAAS